MFFQTQDTVTVLMLSKRLKKHHLLSSISVKSMLENEGNVLQARRAGIGATLIKQG